MPIPLITTAYAPEVLAQGFLPRSRVDGMHWVTTVRFQGRKHALSLVAGTEETEGGHQVHPIPYGSLPRMVLAWINAIAVATKSTSIPMGESGYEFLHHLGMDSSGMRYTALRAQIHALAACKFFLHAAPEQNDRQTTDITPVREFAPWASGSSRSNWPGTLTLRDEYLAHLLKTPVTLDYQSLKRLNGSPSALDVYTWLAYQLPRLDQVCVKMSWIELHELFSPHYGATGDFRKKFITAIQAALTVYPRALVEIVRGGIELQPSPPPDSNERFALRRARAKRRRATA
jgi:hypothetical protein